MYSDKRLASAHKVETTLGLRHGTIRMLERTGKLLPVSIPGRKYGMYYIPDVVESLKGLSGKHEKR